MKILVFLLLLLVSGCSYIAKDEEDPQHWNLDAQYNIPSNNSSFDVTMYQTEDNIIAYPIVQKEQGYYFPSYIENDRLQSMTKDITSKCSYDDPDACSHLISQSNQPPYYYKGQLYYFELTFNTEINKPETIIKAADLDGSNQRELFSEALDDTMNIDTNYVPPTMQFHRNKIYVNHCNQFYIGDLTTNQLQSVTIPGVSVVEKIFLYDETMYITTQEYDDGSALHFHAVLECDLDGHITSLIFEDTNAYEDMSIRFVDKEHIFYTSSNDMETYTWYMMNIPNKTIKKLSDHPYYNILAYEDTYLLDTSDNDTTAPQFIILDNEGNRLHTKEYPKDDIQIAQLYVGNRYYVYLPSKHCFAYYDISEDGIFDRTLIANYE